MPSMMRKNNNKNFAIIDAICGANVLQKPRFLPFIPPFIRGLGVGNEQQKAKNTKND